MILTWVERYLLMCFVVVACNSASASDPAINALQNLPDRGSITWRDWSFDYYIENTNMEGLTLSNVRYRGHKLIARASLPVVRVKYKGNAKHIGSGCGPFPDRFFAWNIAGLLTPALSTGTIRPYPGKPSLSNVVQFQTRDQNGLETLGVYVYAEIGGYLLWHGWNFRSDGVLEPLLYSSGWSCRDGLVKNDHRHHPYWRIVFDIDGAPNQYWEVRSNGAQSPTFRELATEVNLMRKSADDLTLVAASTISTRHILIRFNNDPDSLVDTSGSPWFEFAKIDVGVRRYRAKEDRGWDLDAKDELPHMESPETLSGDATVFWIATHLGHSYRLGSDDENNVDWHWTGPSIQLADWN